MAAVEHTENNFHEFPKNLFPANGKTAVIVAGATISITTIAAGIIFQMPALIYGLCVALSIFCVVIAVYYWKFRKDKNADSPSNFKTSIPLEAPHPEEETSNHNPLAKEVESIQLQDAELIQPCEEQISIAPIKDLIKPSKFNLRNLNNHCYQSSILQLLFAIVPFRNAIMANTRSRLTSAMGKIFHYLNTGENRNQLEDLDCEISKSLDEAKNSNTKFSNGYQEDVTEFLLPLFDAIREETHSEHLLFDGLLRTCIDGLDKKDNFQTFETDLFAEVPLALNAFTTLEQSLCDFTREVPMSGQNQWEIPDGRKIDVVVRNLFQDTPPFLIFHLQRFKFVDGKEMKNSSNFRFSDSIDMAPFMVNTTTPCKYKLAGIVCHQGGVRGGHYITYVLNEDGESFVRLDSIGGEMAATISKDDFMKSNDFIKNSYVALYVRTE